MGKTKRKGLPSRRRGDSDEESHWLRAGLTGQDSLLFDLDPYLYLVDNLVSKTFSQVTHHYDGENPHALAVIVAPNETVPWQAAFFRSRADVAVCIPDFDPILESAGTELDLSIFLGGLPEKLHGQTDFLLFSGSRWESVESYQNAIETTYAALAPGGRACFVFPGSQSAGAVNVEFVDGDRFSLEKLLSAVRSERFDLIETAVLPFAALRMQPYFGVGEFAKRHRGFFGKSARELCLSRLYEEEFQQLIADPNDRCAVALIVGDPQ